MEKTLSFPKSVASKQALIYSLQLHMAEGDYELSETETEFRVALSNVEESDWKRFRNEVLFNELRFQIAERNKDLRRDIIAKALGGVSYGK